MPRVLSSKGTSCATIYGKGIQTEKFFMNCIRIDDRDDKYYLYICIGQGCVTNESCESREWGQYVMRYDRAFIRKAIGIRSE